MQSEEREWFLYYLPGFSIQTSGCHTDLGLDLDSSTYNWEALGEILNIAEAQSSTLK